MDITSLSNAVSTEQVQLLAAVKCIKAQQQTMETAGNIIQDAAEISKEALAKYHAEVDKQ